MNDEVELYPACVVTRSMYKSFQDNEQDSDVSLSEVFEECEDDVSSSERVEM